MTLTSKRERIASFESGLDALFGGACAVCKPVMVGLRHADAMVRFAAALTDRHVELERTGAAGLPYVDHPCPLDL
jgi:hypothetical protein